MSWVGEQNQIIRELKLVSQDGYGLATANLSWRNVKCPLIEVTKNLWDDFLAHKDSTVNCHVNKLTEKCIEYIQMLEADDDEEFGVLQHVHSILYTIDQLQNLSPKSEKAKEYAKSAISSIVDSWDTKSLAALPDLTETKDITNTKDLIIALQKVSTFDSKQDGLVSQIKKSLNFEGEN